MKIKLTSARLSLAIVTVKKLTKNMVAPEMSNHAWWLFLLVRFLDFKNQIVDTRKMQNVFCIISNVFGHFHAICRKFAKSRDLTGTQPKKPLDCQSVSCAILCLCCHNIILYASYLLINISTYLMLMLTRMN